MKSEIKVSVIVPVYNAERYLRICLDSIVAQTLTDIEIICVDDGSTDHSLEILQEYMRNDSRIQVVHQQNMYAGAARNAGKKIARGKYLVFWDSDDYFYPEALEKMYHQCELDSADICVCGANQFLEDIQQEVSAVRYMNPRRIPEQIPFNRKTNPDYILNFTTEAPWNKMFLRSFIEDIRLDFQAIRNGNDIYFVVNALCMAERITVLEDHLLCYRKNQTSSLVGTLYKSPLTPLQAWIDTCENLKKNDIFPRKSFCNKVMASIFYLLHNMSNWEAFQEGFLFLQSEGLQKLSFTEDRDEDFFYTDWHLPCLQHLQHDTPQQFLTYFSYLTYNQQVNALAQKRLANLSLKEQKAKTKEYAHDYKLQCKENRKLLKKLKQQEEENRRLSNQIDAIRNSTAYRLGRILTYIPRKIKNLF